MNILLKQADKLILAMNEHDLSLYAKGLYAYMLLNPSVTDGEELKRQCSSIDSTEILFDLAAKELVDSGYISIQRVSNHALRVMK